MIGLKRRSADFVQLCPSMVHRINTFHRLDITSRVDVVSHERALLQQTRMFTPLSIAKANSRKPYFYSPGTHFPGCMKSRSLQCHVGATGRLERLRTTGLAYDDSMCTLPISILYPILFS